MYVIWYTYEQQQAGVDAPEELNCWSIRRQFYNKWKRFKLWNFVKIEEVWHNKGVKSEEFAIEKSMVAQKVNKTQKPQQNKSHNRSYSKMGTR